MNLSIVIPVYNEEENLGPLSQELKGVLAHLNREYEIIFVNDGSRDKSFEILRELAGENLSIKVINFKKNYGQTAAISAGVKDARGEIIILMDADLQNDPADIPKLLDKIGEGFNVVSGWRKKRKDKFLTCVLPSRMANFLISWVTRVKLHDYGCTLKAYEKEFIRDVNLYGEMHRFIPAYARWEGARIAEITTNHRPRIHGKSKYGLSKMFRVILDLLVVKFLSKYIDRPIHFFGYVGFVSLALGFISGLATVILRVMGLATFIETPLPTLTVFFVIVGIQFILMGLLAEIIVRVYFGGDGNQVYKIKEKINF